MVNLWALYRRETNSVFLSPIVYIFTTVFLVVTGFFFYVYVRDAQTASLRWVFSNIGIILLFFAPAITMRLLAEEGRSGTLETLMTAPVTEIQVVLGKFFAGLTFYLVMLAPTLAYILILRVVAGEVGIDYGPILSAYLGLLLMGGLFISIGLFFSSLTRNQIVAFAITLAVFLLLWVLGMISRDKSGPVHEVIKYIGMFEHIDAFVKGLIDTRDILYYVSATLFFLFLTVRSVESRKWR
ncbi:MAG: ABC transporter permease subunit [Planctomycetes bacterium]|nr:ABC transporter permease subunit [Planctomycetota bacterium]